MFRNTITAYYNNASETCKKFHFNHATNFNKVLSKKEVTKEIQFVDWDCTYQYVQFASQQTDNDINIKSRATKTVDNRDMNDNLKNISNPHLENEVQIEIDNFMNITNQFEKMFEFSNFQLNNNILTIIVFLFMYFVFFVKLNVKFDFDCIKQFVIFIVQSLIKNFIYLFSNLLYFIFDNSM